MSTVLRLPRTLVDQLSKIATRCKNQRGIGRVYLDKNGNYFCAAPGKPRSVEKDDELFALFEIYDNSAKIPDNSIISSIRKPTVYLGISFDSESVLEVRAWECKAGAATERVLEFS